MKWGQILIRILFMIYPAVLYYLGYLDPDESFLLILVSQLALAIRLFVWVPVALSLDFSTKRKINAENASFMSYFFGGFFVLLLWLFTFVIYFGILYSCFESEVNPLGESTSVFESEHNGLLVKSLMFNFLFFLFLEGIELLKQYRFSKNKSIALLDVYLFNYPFSTLNSFKKGWAMIWFLMGFAVLLFLCSARQFEWAIYFFIGFDALWRHFLGWTKS